MQTDGAVATRTRVLVIQPHTLVRQGMVGILDSAEGCQVVAHTGAVEDGIRLAREFQPDVVVIDVDLPGGSAGMISEVKATLEGGAVLAMAEGASQSQVERALSEGADGYTLKGIGIQEFVETVTRVCQGELMLHPQAAACLARSFSAIANGHRGGEPVLTHRQREIVELMVQGLQNKQIARRLGIGVETVKTHISRILERLGVSSRTEAVVVALRDGLVA